MHLGPGGCQPFHSSMEQSVHSEATGKNDVLDPSLPIEQLSISKRMTMMMKVVAFLFLLSASVSAFQSSRPLTYSNKVSTTSIVKPLYVILSDEETEKILQSASDCAEGECSIDDVSELIAELKEQEKEMQSRLEKIMNMIAHLQHINAKEERKTDEVRAFVRDLLRTFSSDKPLYFPTGFAGEVGDGPTTAYDALPPKKWVPTDKK